MLVISVRETKAQIPVTKPTTKKGKNKKEKNSVLFFFIVNVLYGISFGRVLIRQTINANVGNLKTFKPLLMLLRLTDSVES